MNGSQKLDNISDIQALLKKHGMYDLFKLLVNIITKPSPPPNPTLNNSSGCDATVDVEGNTQNSNATLNGVTLKMNNGNSTFIPASSVATNGDYSATMNGAWCNTGPDCSDNPDNYCESSAHWEFFGFPIDEIAVKYFPGECQNEIESVGAAVSECKDQVAQINTVCSSGKDPNKRIDDCLSKPLPVEPEITNSDGWYYYPNVLSPYPQSPGVVLCNGGEPLKGTQISCYTNDMAWCHHGNVNESIYRPSGMNVIANPGITISFSEHKRITVGREPFRFPGVSKGALCVLQRGCISSPSEKFNVIEARSRELHDIFCLNKKEPILIKVNDSFETQVPHTGEIGLWVKVKQPAEKE